VRGEHLVEAVLAKGFERGEPRVVGQVSAVHLTPTVSRAAPIRGPGSSDVR
jgi:hypothetical protein